MRLVLLLASVAAVSLAAPSGRAQHAADLLPSASLSAEPAAPPLPSVLAPSQARADAAEPYATELERTEAQRRRSPWRYPALGALGGALAGAAFGTALMVGSDEWIGIPAHIFTVPGGAVLGAAVGGLMNLAIRR